MELLIIIALVAVTIFLLKMVMSHATQKRKVFKNGVYKYTLKDSVMTRAEGEFFCALQRVVQDRYFVFPQIHLSALLNHTVKGQNWGPAFRHINGKSVDYVLCDKTTLRPVYAIELDDSTHDHADRVTRDKEVDRIFRDANIPLVRFKDYKSLSEQDIANSLAHARKLEGK